MNIQSPPVVWFTGLPGSGKYEISHRVYQQLKTGGHHCEHLDDHTLRTIYPTSPVIRKDCNMAIKSAGYIASTLQRHGIQVAASFVSPYRADRNFVRYLCQDFVEVYMSASPEVCLQRLELREDEQPLLLPMDRYVRTFEAPESPDLAFDISQVDEEEAVGAVLKRMRC